MYRYNLMSRNPGNADRLMLEAAKKIVCKEGCSGLRIRDLVKRAGVNLGMFHYHFRTKERFKQALLQELYEDFFEKLTSASKEEAPTAVAQLRATLLAMATFVRSKSEFYLAIFKDVSNGDPEVISFIERNIPRHMAVIGQLVERCQSEGSMVSIPFPQILAFLMTSTNIPILIGAAVRGHKRSRERSGMKPQEIKNYEVAVLSDEAIAQRIDLALKGLSP
jgi:AcrR family transcriptional regulator